MFINNIGKKVFKFCNILCPTLLGANALHYLNMSRQKLLTIYIIQASSVAHWVSTRLVMYAPCRRHIRIIENHCTIASFVDHFIALSLRTQMTFMKSINKYNSNEFILLYYWYINAVHNPRISYIYIYDI